MANHDDTETDRVLHYVENLDLPDATAHYVDDTGEPLNILPPSFQQPKDQAIVVGSQIAGFSEEVDPSIRPSISNAFLLAQLAANKHLAVHGGDSNAWYAAYLNVLANIGFTIEGDAQAKQVVTGTSLQVHQEILPVITAALGPAASAAATIVTVLKGLSNMDKDKPWITLFSQESRRAEANQFQVSHARVVEGKPRVTLLAFELEAESSVTQILFFKFATDEAKLKHFEMNLSVNATAFDSAKAMIAARISEHITSYVSQIDI